jgi:thiol-disulfide isomerase/thioredoxin
LYQASAQGTTFEKGLTWTQVLKKAKENGKYIFVDCFTTWCGPCKAMDREVYPNDSVGNFLNKNFISVKMQMDKSASDNEQVRDNYVDAEMIEKKYHISSYPTYLFFSPAGDLVHKAYGLKYPADFLATAKEALIPGKTYKDPFSRYDSLIIGYKSGKKNFKEMSYMLREALKAGDLEVAKMLANDYYKYLQTLPEKELYTIDNIEFISSQVHSSKDPFFKLFFPNAQKVNNIMRNPFFATKVVDQIIMQEEIEKYLGKEGSLTNTIQAVVPIATAEPNWNKLYDSIRNKYNKEYASRNILNAKILWYGNYQWWPQWIRSYVTKINTFGYDTADIMEALTLNGVAWQIFLDSNDQSQLTSAAEWMEDVCKRDQSHSMWRAMDTYANLLYKLGRTKEALHWEEKALYYAKLNQDKSSISSFTIIIKTMESGAPTWINYDDLSSQPL